MNSALKRNCPDNKKNDFDKDKVFFVASFNDWLPVELKSLFEIKLKKNKGKDFQKFLAESRQKNPAALEPKKKEEGILQYTNYIPTGKHFFYFMYQDQYIFLSPRYDIVRFKGSNVFLNKVTIKERAATLK